MSDKRDFIIIDDVEDESRKPTPESRQRINEWYERIKDKATVFVVNVKGKVDDGS